MSYDKYINGLGFSMYRVDNHRGIYIYAWDSLIREMVMDNRLTIWKQYLPLSGGSLLTTSTPKVRKLMRMQELKSGIGFAEVK